MQCHVFVWCLCVHINPSTFGAKRLIYTNFTLSPHTHGNTRVALALSSFLFLQSSTTFHLSTQLNNSRTQKGGREKRRSDSISKIHFVHVYFCLFCAISFWLIKHIAIKWKRKSLISYQSQVVSLCCWLTISGFSTKS